MSSSPEEALFALALAKPAEKRADFFDVMCKAAMPPTSAKVDPGFTGSKTVSG